MLALLAVGTAVADIPAPAFDRYQIILDRKPFGELPPPVQEAPKPPPEQVIAKFYRLCSIVQEDDGTLKVGIVDTRGNKFTVLSPGQSENGLTVVEASYKDETAVLQLGEEMQLLELKSGAATAMTPGGAKPQIAAAPPGPTPPMPPPGMSYAERRRQRMLEQHEPKEPPQPKYTGEALQKHLQDYQMEVIRQGLPPLPIPLTPEQDTQLVKEGVLPPQQ